MARRRVVVIEEEYRVIRHSPPPLPPPKRDSGGDGGGGWFATAVGFGLCFLIAVGIQKLTDGHASPSPVVKETGRRVIVASNIEGERCLAPPLQTASPGCGRRDPRRPARPACRFRTASHYAPVWPRPPRQFAAPTLLRLDVSQSGR